MSSRLDFVAQAKVYTLYDPYKTSQTKAPKMSAKDESQWLKTQIQKDKEFCKLSASQNLQSSYFADIQKDKRPVSRCKKSTPKQAVKAEPQKRQLVIKNWEGKVLDNDHNKKSQFQLSTKQQTQSEADLRKNSKRQGGRLSKELVGPRRPGYLGCSTNRPTSRQTSDKMRSSSNQIFGSKNKQEMMTPIRFRKDLTPPQFLTADRDFDHNNQPNLPPIKQRFENRLKIDTQLSPVKSKSKFQSSQPISKTTMEHRKFDLTGNSSLSPVPKPSNKLRLQNPQIYSTPNSPKLADIKVPSFNNDLFDRMNKLRVNKGQGFKSRLGLIS